jgi:CheY-like chemotaxis protein/two-component sensor histidine kinase
VRQGVDRVQHIVRALKTFSRGDDDDRQPRRLDAPLLTALDMAAPEIRGRARVEQDLRPVPLVAASEVRLSQVFLNLLINAAQAIPPGAADRNQITVRLFTDARGWAVAEVQDTGCGVAPEIRASIFDPFFTTKPVGLGTGLGLSISQGIVRTLGGELTVESEPGHGATFRFALPPAGAAPAPATATPAAGTAPATTPTAPPRSGPRRRVLVIDDERLVAGSLERTLAAEHDVTLAAGGQEALERVARGEHWDRILCDVMMPGMTGFEFHSRLTAVAPALAGRVTFMTGGACERTRAFLASWPGGFLEKPIDAAALHRAVRA